MHPRCVLAAMTALAAASRGLNILITQLTWLGHTCYIVAPATDQSGATSQTFTTSPKLKTNSEWNVVGAGAPSIGADPHDNHIWYYTGTPATQVLVALDYVLPNFAKIQPPDLVISGPNSGWTLGPFVYTLSGSIGATIAAVERGIPAISFSSGNTDSMPYNWVNASTKVGLQDPATITARLASSLVQAMIEKAAGSPILPRGYGVSVNMPNITSYLNDKCTNPPFILTRMVANTSNKAMYNQGTSLFRSSSDSRSAAAIAERHVLPAERDVIASHCMSSVTAFIVQFDPSFHGQCINITDVTALVPLVVQVSGSSPLDGPGANATIVVVGNSPHPSNPSSNSPQPPLTTIAGLGAKTQMSLSALLLCLGVATFIL